MDSGRRDVENALCFVQMSRFVREIRSPKAERFKTQWCWSTAWPTFSRTGEWVVLTRSSGVVKTRWVSGCHWVALTWLARDRSVSWREREVREREWDETRRGEKKQISLPTTISPGPEVRSERIERRFKERASPLLKVWLRISCDYSLRRYWRLNILFQKITSGRIFLKFLLSKDIRRIKRKLSKDDDTQTERLLFYYWQQKVDKSIGYDFRRHSKIGEATYKFVSLDLTLIGRRKDRKISNGDNALTRQDYTFLFRLFPKWELLFYYRRWVVDKSCSEHEIDKFKGKGGRVEIRMSEQRDYAGIKRFVLRVSK